jgi:hypothetical protein
VTGLVVNDKPNVRRSEIPRLRSILHRAGREGLEAQNRERRPDFRARLEGKIAYIRMVRPEIAVKPTEELRKLASKRFDVVSRVKSQSREGGNSSPTEISNITAFIRHRHRSVSSEYG